MLPFVITQRTAMQCKFKCVRARIHAHMQLNKTPACICTCACGMDVCILSWHAPVKGRGVPGANIVNTRAAALVLLQKRALPEMALHVGQQPGQVRQGSFHGQLQNAKGKKSKIAHQKIVSRCNSFQDCILGSSSIQLAIRLHPPEGVSHHLIE